MKAKEDVPEGEVTREGTVRGGGLWEASVIWIWKPGLGVTVRRKTAWRVNKKWTAERFVVNTDISFGEHCPDVIAERLFQKCRNVIGLPELSETLSAKYLII